MKNVLTDSQAYPQTDSRTRGQPDRLMPPAPVRSLRRHENAEQKKIRQVILVNARPCVYIPARQRWRCGISY